MTDKELKKLSRLELLEMLLRLSQENKQLKEALMQSKSDAATKRTSNHISNTAKQLDVVLENAKRLTGKLGNLADNPPSPKLSTLSITTLFPDKAGQNKDIDIYKRLMLFFANNPNALYSIDEGLRVDIVNRIKEIICVK